MCGFYLKNDLLFYTNKICKEIRDMFIRNILKYTRTWDLSGSGIIMELGEEHFRVKPTDLDLFCIFI